SVLSHAVWMLNALRSAAWLVESTGLLLISDHCKRCEPGLFTTRAWLLGSGPPSSAVNERTGGITSSTGPTLGGKGRTVIWTCTHWAGPTLEAKVINPL